MKAILDKLVGKKITAARPLTDRELMIGGRHSDGIVIRLDDNSEIVIRNKIVKTDSLCQGEVITEATLRNAGGNAVSIPARWPYARRTGAAGFGNYFGRCRDEFERIEWYCIDVANGIEMADNGCQDEGLIAALDSVEESIVEGFFGEADGEAAVDAVIAAVRRIEDQTAPPCVKTKGADNADRNRRLGDRGRGRRRSKT